MTNITKSSNVVTEPDLLLENSALNLAYRVDGLLRTAILAQENETRKPLPGGNGVTLTLEVALKISGETIAALEDIWCRRERALLSETLAEGEQS